MVLVLIARQKDGVQWQQQNSAKKSVAWLKEQGEEMNNFELQCTNYKKPE